MICKPIARIYNDFPTKFGLPRQSGMSEHLISRIIMEPEYRSPEAFRGIEEFDCLWLIWEFEPMGKRDWSPTVRPPKLGGNQRMGVFATRSPNRPNPLGLTRVKLVKAELHTPQGPVLHVAGADLMSGTVIFDIKPYLPYAESVPEARGGYADAHSGDGLEVRFPAELLNGIPETKRDALLQALRLDPRPAYQDDPERVYGFLFAGKNVRFRVTGNCLTVVAVEAAG